jgi:hypothetical protein
MKRRAATGKKQRTNQEDFFEGGRQQGKLGDMDVAAGVTIKQGETERKGPNIYTDPKRVRKEFMVSVVESSW